MHNRLEAADSGKGGARREPVGLGLGPNSATHHYVVFSYQNTLIMGRNRVLDDLDHISVDPKDVKPSKAPPPAV